MNCSRETVCRSDVNYSLRKRDSHQVAFNESSFAIPSSRRNHRVGKLQTTNLRKTGIRVKSVFIIWLVLASRRVTQMGNKGSTGPFAPIVVITRDIVGTKKFNTFRGKAIALHSQGKTI